MEAVPHSRTSTGAPPARTSARVAASQARIAHPDPGFHPWLGMFSTGLGTLLAMIATPFNPKTEGALFLSGVLMTLGLATAPTVAFFANPRNILRAENIIGLAPIYWLFLDLITAVYDMPNVTDIAVRKTFLSIGLFVVMFWAGTLGRPWRLPTAFMASCAFRPNVQIILSIAAICFVVGMLSFAIPCKFDLGLMFRSLLNDRWAAPWSRGEFGGWDAFVNHLQYFGYLLPTFAVMILRRKGFFNVATLVAFLLASIYLLFIMHSGARRIIGVMLGAAISFWVLDRERVRVWQLAVAAGIIAIVLWLMQAMLVVRGVGLGNVGLENAGRIAWMTMRGDQTMEGAPKGLAVDDNFYRVVQVISVIPEKHPYVYWRQLYYVLARPIPRVLWEGKPIDGGFSLEEYNNSGASLSMTVVGEMWMSWGYVAVLLGGWCFGRISRMSSPLFNVSRGSIGPMFYGYMTMILFVGWRSLVEVLLFSYALLGWIAATWIYAKIKGR